MALFGDSITTDHISPADNIAERSPADQWLLAQGVQQADFNSYRADGIWSFVLRQQLQDDPSRCQQQSF